MERTSSGAMRPRRVTRRLLAAASGLIGLGLALVGCKPDGVPTPDSSSPEAVNVLFLHHSTGGVVWDGGVDNWFSRYNADKGTEYRIYEAAYPHSPYPWSNDPYDYWKLWVESPGTRVQGQEALEELAARYDVVVLKHCFPVSDMVPDSGTPDPSSTVRSPENLKAQYEDLRTRLREFEDTTFVLWTGAALVEESTVQERAELAGEFFDWVRQTWDEPGDNIHLWDFRQLETKGGLYLLPEHAAGPGDSHPNASFAQQVAPLFAQRLVDVIEGRGDTTSITGQ